MSTLTGVIKASTKIGTDAVPAESDLYMASGYFILTSRPYPLIDTHSSLATKASVKELPSIHTLEQSGSTSVAILGGQSSGTWKQVPEPEEMNATATIDRIVKTRTSRYSSYTVDHEEMNATATIDRIVKTRTIRFTTYAPEPEEMDATVTINRIVKTRVSGTPP